jgi:DNA-binding response OmpR family regulator
MAAANHYHLIVLDWLLPRRDGLAVCGDLRGRGVRTPILMLTARDSLSDRHVSHLRRKIDGERRWALIHTVRARGFRLGGPE